MVCPCLEVHRRTSLMSFSLFVKQCPAYLVGLISMVCEMCGKWPYCSCFAECCFQDYAQNSIVCRWQLAFTQCVSSKSWWGCHTTVLTRLQIRSLSIAADSFPISSLTYSLMDEISQLRYVNRGTQNSTKSRKAHKIKTKHVLMW